MPQTFAELTQRVIHAVGEVPGTSVQTYSEPRVLEALTEIFNMVLRKNWWPQYMAWYQLTLDGVNGVVTDDSFGDAIKDVRDIKIILPNTTGVGKERGIPILPDSRNPFLLSGTTPLYYESLNADNSFYAGRLVQFWPKTSTGSVAIHARSHPTVAENLINQLDDDLLVHGAAWMVIDVEDVNPNAAKLYERMFNELYTDIMKQYANQPIENSVTGYPSDRYLSEWFVY